MPVSNSLRHRQVIEIESVQIATRELSDRSASSFGHASVSGHFAGVRITSQVSEKDAQGTGMGLPISRSIIESHGGRLWAVAHSGRAATFQFTLPSEAPAHQAA